MKLCTIRTVHHQRVNEAGQVETGQYELEVRANYIDIHNSGDPKGYVQHVIATHLAGCIRHTGIPLNERMWEVEFSPWAVKTFEFPKGFTS